MQDADADNDFLARERAALGQDADQFTTTNDVPSVSVQDGGDDDLLGGGDDGQTNGNTDMNQFQKNFPAVDTRNEVSIFPRTFPAARAANPPQRMAPGGTFTGSASPYLPGALRASSPQPPSTFNPTGEEPEVIKSWREERDTAISKREEAAASRKETTIKEAQTSIDEFYENYNQKREKGVAQTRKEAEEFLSKREDTTAGGTSWERIAKLVDLRKGGNPGKERFRELLGSLAKDENAPGAKGY